MSIWDDPELQPAGNYVKFDNPGDAVTGTILAIRKHTFADGKVAAELIIRTDTGEDVTVTAGQIQLARKLAELRPAEGDRIGIRYDSSEKRDGGKTLKHFTVQVQNGNGQPAPAAQPAPAQPAAAQPVAAQPAADSLI